MPTSGHRLAARPNTLEKNTARITERLANRVEVDTTPYEMRLTQMGQNPLATRQNEPWC